METKGANNFLVFSSYSIQKKSLFVLFRRFLGNRTLKYITVLCIYNVLIESCKMVTECAAVSSQRSPKRTIHGC